MKKYIISIEMVKDCGLIFSWLDDGHFKHWPHSAQRYITVVCTDNRFESWFALKLESNPKKLTGSIEYYIKIG